jgi:hypothetical protein
MKYFSSFFVLYLMIVNAGNAAYLPVVDVSRGDVSARALFGEEIVPQKTVAVAPRASENKKVVARSATKMTNANSVGADVLKPNRPSSDLWARSAEEPLRMPRMDEIAVINFDTVLPEESLSEKPTVVARNEKTPMARDEALNELKQLRAEVARLAKLQKESEEKIANARPIPVRTPIIGETNVKSGDEKRSVSVRREVVPSVAEPKMLARTAISEVAEPKMVSVNEMSKMSPNELKKAFKKTYLSENKHLSTYTTDNRYDEVSDMSSSIEGFSAQRDLSEMDSGVRPLEIKISFLNGDSGLSRENYLLLTESASIVVNNPKRAIQVAIPESATHTKDSRKLAARRLAIIEQVLRDTGIAEQRIVPVLSQRDGDEFVLRIISGEVFESLSKQKRNMFGDSVSNKTYKSMTW